jgi:hypothetical protein
VFLNYMPKTVMVSNGMNMPESEIPLDAHLVDLLRKI